MSTCGLRECIFPQYSFKVSFSSSTLTSDIERIGLILRIRFGGVEGFTFNDFYTFSFFTLADVHLGPFLNFSVDSHKFLQVNLYTSGHQMLF